MDRCIDPSNARDHVVTVSIEAYRRVKRRAREALTVGTLSDAELEAIARTEMAPSHQHLDLELE